MEICNSGRMLISDFITAATWIIRHRIPSVS